MIIENLIHQEIKDYIEFTKSFSIESFNLQFPNICILTQLDGDKDNLICVYDNTVLLHLDNRNYHVDKEIKLFNLDYGFVIDLKNGKLVMVSIEEFLTKTGLNSSGYDGYLKSYLADKEWRKLPLEERIQRNKIYNNIHYTKHTEKLADKENSELGKQIQNSINKFVNTNNPEEYKPTLKEHLYFNFPYIIYMEELILNTKKPRNIVIDLTEGIYNKKQIDVFEQKMYVGTVLDLITNENVLINMGIFYNNTKERRF